MNPENQRTWMIRYIDRTYSRPFSEKELMDLFRTGGMKPTDELCSANHYWFSVQDVNEMRKHFGNISLEGIFQKSKDEVTQERMASTAKIVVSELKGFQPEGIRPENQGDSINPSKKWINQALIAILIIFLILTVAQFWI